MAELFKTMARIARMARTRARLSNIYYSPRGYWKGLAAVKKLASAGKVSEDEARAWLKKQAIWQIYLLAPRTVSPGPSLMSQSPTPCIKLICFTSLTTV